MFDSCMIEYLHVKAFKGKHNCPHGTNLIIFEEPKKNPPKKAKHNYIKANTSQNSAKVFYKQKNLACAYARYNTVHT